MKVLRCKPQSKLLRVEELYDSAARMWVQLLRVLCAVAPAESR